jgi:hypothetical protein
MALAIQSNFVVIQGFENVYANKKKELKTFYS